MAPPKPSPQHVTLGGKPTDSIMGDRSRSRSPRPKKKKQQQLNNQQRQQQAARVKDHDIFLLPTRDYEIMLALTALAAAVRLYRIWQPTSVVFDEVQ